jgi:hypothetical protein
MFIFFPADVFFCFFSLLKLIITVSLAKLKVFQAIISYRMVVRTLLVQYDGMG